MSQKDDKTTEIIKIEISKIYLPKITPKPVFPFAYLQFPTVVILICVILLFLRVVNIVGTTQMVNFCN